MAKNKGGCKEKKIPVFANRKHTSKIFKIQNFFLYLLWYGKADCVGSAEIFTWQKIEAARSAKFFIFDQKMKKCKGILLHFKPWHGKIIKGAHSALTLYFLPHMVKDQMPRAAPKIFISLVNRWHIKQEPRAAPKILGMAMKKTEIISHATPRDHLSYVVKSRFFGSIFRGSIKIFWQGVGSEAFMGGVKKKFFVGGGRNPRAPPCAHLWLYRPLDCI